MKSSSPCRGFAVLEAVLALVVILAALMVSLRINWYVSLQESLAHALMQLPPELDTLSLRLHSGNVDFFTRALLKNLEDERKKDRSELFPFQAVASVLHQELLRELPDAEITVEVGYLVVETDRQTGGALGAKAGPWGEPRDRSGGFIPDSCEQWLTRDNTIIGVCGVGNHKSRKALLQNSSAVELLQDYLRGGKHQVSSPYFLGSPLARAGRRHQRAYGLSNYAGARAGRTTLEGNPYTRMTQAKFAVVLGLTFQLDLRESSVRPLFSSDEEAQISYTNIYPVSREF